VSRHLGARIARSQSPARAPVAPPAAADALEREADHAAEHALQSSDSVPVDLTHPDPGLTSLPQRKAAGESSTSASTGHADVDHVLQSPGRPLDAATRVFYERRLGADFSGVKVHADGDAAASARSIAARAYTVGNHIVFGDGQFAPGFDHGRRLIAHELTHVLQQGAGSPRTIRRQAAGEAAAPAPGAAPGGAPAGPALADMLDYNAIAAELREAMAGLGTDEEGVYFALNRLRRDPEAIKRLKDKYRKLYHVELLDEIHDEFSGTELNYALQLLNEGDTSSDQAIAAAPTTPLEWRKALNRLHDAFEGPGTDEEAVFAVLTPLRREPTPLTTVKAGYKQLFTEDLRERIADEMSGSERDYALWLLGEQPIDRDNKGALAKLKIVVDNIKIEAQKRAKAPPSIDPSSKFYQILKTRYLSDYFANPNEQTGRAASEDKIGRQMKGHRIPVGNQEGLLIEAEGGPRPVASQWEAMAMGWLGDQKLPSQLKNMKNMPLLKNLQGLPTNLGAATDILRVENIHDLGYIDVPQLIGKPNLDVTNFDADVTAGGKNISQLMHWATGVKYSNQSPEALRELFLGYEMWHLEGWEVFGQDSINDLIAENQGRLLGAELRKGNKGQLKTEADLLPFLNQSFRESRAWVGTLLRARRNQLDAWVMSREQRPANIHYMEKVDIWPSLTLYQMLADGMPVDEVSKSFMAESATELYTLVFEADEWDAAHGPIQLTSLEKALLAGKLDTLLEIMAKAEVGKASLPDLMKASNAISDLKGVK
jgi:uncharacterized protein DUF4157/annexin-like protein